MRQSLIYIALLLAGVVHGADFKPLAETGKSLFHENFTAAELGDKWRKGPGEYRLQDKILTIAEKPADMHVAALRAMVPVQNAVVTVQFKLGSAKVLHLGFDPAPGELKDRVGHLFNVVLDGKTLTVQKAGDKQNKEIKPRLIDRVPCEIDAQEWQRLTVTINGPQVQAVVNEKIVAAGSDEEFKVKKPALIFRVGGGAAEFKQLEVFEVRK